jgi:DNA invertase Pin-like site-specific DNA recombinase
MKTAFGYMRTSSAASVGEGKDSEKRQREAIEDFARRNDFNIVGWYYDAAVSGADPLHERAGFADMLTAIAGNGTKTVVVETANRFARDLIVQETGHRRLRDLGIELIAADSPDTFVHDTPTARLVRQVLGAVSEFEKASLVAKLRGARQRKKAATGKCEGRKSLVETRPDLAARAQELRATGLPLRAIGAQLAAEGLANEHGRPFNPKTVRSLLR